MLNTVRNFGDFARSDVKIGIFQRVRTFAEMPQSLEAKLLKILSFVGQGDICDDDGASDDWRMNVRGHGMKGEESGV